MGELFEYLELLFRWGHVVFGIAWIGLLYYFNLIQGGFAAAASADTKVELFTKLVPNALWYFRYAALFTVLTGLVLTFYIWHHGQLNVGIVVGILLALFMFSNVWLIIWPNQKKVIAANEAIAAGNEPGEDTAEPAAKALLASRTNTLFSLPMLFFMINGPHGFGLSVEYTGLSMILGALIVIAIEANAIFGKLGPITTVKGVISSSVILTAILWVVVIYLPTLTL